MGLFGFRNRPGSSSPRRKQKNKTNGGGGAGDDFDGIVGNDLGNSINGIESLQEPVVETETSRRSIDNTRRTTTNSSNFAVGQNQPDTKLRTTTTGSSSRFNRIRSGLLFRKDRTRTATSEKSLSMEPNRVVVGNEHTHRSLDYNLAHNNANNSIIKRSSIDHDSSLSSSGPPPTVSSRNPGSFQPTNIQTKITEATNESATVGGGGIGGSMSTSFNPASSKPPPARMAAFHGPPRFDWIDIEYAAATKIQSIQRRNLVMADLEAKGYSTSAIRNARRRRKASNRSYRYKVAAHEETPSVFGCCAMGLAFGDATDPTPDDDAFREYQRKQYQEKVTQRAAYEDDLRAKYMQQHGILDSVAMLEKVEMD